VNHLTCYEQLPCGTTYHMEILSAMVADAATAFNGKLYVHGGGWDALVVRQFPAAHPSMALAVLLSADASEAPGTGEFRVQLVDEDGNDLGVGAAAIMGLGHGPFYRPGQRSLVPIAIPFNEIRFDRPGTYEFRLFWNGQQLTPSVAFSVTPPPPMMNLGQALPAPGAA
jgi:hypothetical protein